METNLAQLIHHIADDKSSQLVQEATKQLESMKINDPINLILSFLDFLSVNIYTNLDKTQANSLHFAAAAVGRVLMVNSTKEHQAYWAGIPEHLKDKIKKKLSISMFKNHSIEVNRQLGVIIGSIASLPEQEKKDSWLKQTMKEFFQMDNQASLYNVLIILKKYFERSIELNWLEESELVNTLVYGLKIKHIQIKMLTLQTIQNYILKYDIITNENTPLKKIVSPLYQNICQISKDPNHHYTERNLKILDEILKYRLSFFVPTLDQLYHCFETIIKNKAKNPEILDTVITIAKHILSECFKRQIMKYVYRATQLMITYIQQIDLHLYNSKTQQAQTLYLAGIQQVIGDKVKQLKQQINWILINLKLISKQRKQALLNYLENRVRQLIQQGQTNCFVASILVSFLNNRFEQIKYYFQKFAKMLCGQSIPLKYIACWGFQSICYEGNDFIDNNSYSIYALLIAPLLDKSSRVSIKSCQALCALLKHCSQNKPNQESLSINYNEINSKILQLIRSGQPSLQIQYLDCLNESCYFFKKETIAENIGQVYKFLIQLIQKHQHSEDYDTCMMVCKATCTLFTVMKRVQQKFTEEDWAIAFRYLVDVKKWVFQVRKCADWIIQAGNQVVLQVNKYLLLQNQQILNTYLHLMHQTLALTHNRLSLNLPLQNPQSKPDNKELSQQQQKYMRFLQNFKNKIIKDTTIEDMQLQEQKFQTIASYFKQCLIQILYVNNPGIFISVCHLVTDYCQQMRRLKGDAALADASKFVRELLGVVDPDGNYQIVNTAVFTLKQLTSQQLTSEYLTKNQCQVIFTKLSTLYWNYSLKTKFENQSKNMCLIEIVRYYGTGYEKRECQQNIMHILISIIKGHYTLCLPYIEIAMHNLVPFQLSLDTQDFKLRAYCGLIFISQFLSVLHGLSLKNKIEGAEGLIKNLLKSFRSILENKDYRSQIGESRQKMKKSFQLLNQIRLQQMKYGTLLPQENWSEVGALLKCKQAKKI